MPVYWTRNDKLLTCRPLIDLRKWPCVSSTDSELVRRGNVPAHIEPHRIQRFCTRLMALMVHFMYWNKSIISDSAYENLISEKQW